MYLNIDGTLRKCQETKSFGLLGRRHILMLGNNKRMLIRDIPWGAVSLTIDNLPHAGRLNLRHARLKTYPDHQGPADKAPKPRPVLQQDITELIPLEAAVRKVMADRQPARIWGLVLSSCRSLRRLGQASGSELGVPLQCPPSLAVGPNNRVVALDAEVRIDGDLPQQPEASQAYAKWFGQYGQTGHAHIAFASQLHAKAVLLYIRELLGELIKAGTIPDPQLARQVMAQIEVLLNAPHINLETLEKFIEDNRAALGITEDFGIDLPEEEEQLLSGALPGQPQAPATRKKRVFLKASLWINLLLVIAVTLLILLWPKGKTQPGQPGQPSQTGGEPPTGEAPAPRD